MSLKSFHRSLAVLLAGTASVASAQALTSNESQVANAIATPTLTPTAATVGVQNSLAGLTAANQQAAYAQFTPGGYGLLPELTLRTAEFEEQTIRRYLRDFRAGGTGVNGEAGVAAPGDRKFGSFLVGGATDGHYDADTDRNRTKYTSTNVMGGIDYRLGERSLVGVTGGYVVADTRLDSSSPNSQIRNWFGGGYGTLGVGPLYLDLFGTYGKANYDLRRSVSFGNDTATPTLLDYASNTKSRTWVGGATTGLSFSYKGFEFEPFVGARYANLRINGFSDGNDIGSIAMGSDKYESVLGNAGLRVGASFTIGEATFRPEIRGAYRHEFLKDGQNSFTYDFGGAGGATAANFIPTRLGRDYATGGAGVTISGAHSPLSFVVDYNGEFASDRRINAFTGGLRMTF